MARYVIASRRAGKFRETEKEAARSAVVSALGSLTSATLIQDNKPTDPLARRVVVIEVDSSEIASKKAEMPGEVIIEPEILHWPAILPPRDFMPMRPGGTMPAGTGTTFDVTVTGDNQPLANAQVNLFIRGWGGSRSLTGRTNSAGWCRFPMPPGHEVAAALVVPVGGFWTMIARGLAVGLPIECPPLPADGPIGWWHQVLGLNADDADRGAGIRVGVIDTGVGPHPSLTHANLAGAFIDGDHHPGAETRDVDSHGTHVAGTIGARPTNAGHYAGIAPNCDLFAARVFPGPDRGASNADIANAIDELSRVHAVDLVNMSLGAAIASEVVHDAIVDAFERGTLCICAAGNEAGPVSYPAAFPEAVAVSALGLAGWGPPGSLAATRLPLETDRFGRQNLYLANFSCFGPQIASAAPGVGVIAPVPNPFGQDALHGSMDGTSMACPVACGALAAILSADASYQDLPRDSGRAQAARSLLLARLRDIGLHANYQGRGVPFLPDAVV